MAIVGSTEPSERIGTEVLFENDRVRIWEMTLEPGESSGPHWHRNDYFFVYVTPGNEMEVRFANGDVLPEASGDGFVKSFVVGSEPGPEAAHELRNVGSTPHRQIIVELLEPSRAETPQPPEDNGRASTSADPPAA